MQIKFISVESVDKVTKTNKPYVELEVAYKNIDFGDKLEVKKLNPFGNKDVYNTLKTAKSGEVYDIERVKNEGGFWDWVSIKGGNAAQTPSQTATVASGSTSFTSPKSTYETADERAKKQVYIVRQSSISAAIETLKTDKKNPSVQDVIETARQYEAFVFGQETKPVLLADLPPNDEDDDIPM